MPISGTVIEFNAKLEDAPELVNQSPYGDGWIIKVELSDPNQVNEGVARRLFTPNRGIKEDEASQDLDENGHDDEAVKHQQQPPLTITINFLQKLSH